MASGVGATAGTEAIHWAVWRWAEQTPAAIAVSDRGRQLSYRELADRADALARTLIHLGVGREVLVGISAERSAAFVIAILGVLRAGAAYVPIDPSYPPERRSFLIEDAQCAVLLTDARLQSLYAETAARIIPLDAFVEGKVAAVPPPSSSPASPSVLPVPSPPPPQPALPAPGPADDSLAYVIYTSGSTGKPKGVCVSHHNLLRLFRQTEAWFHPSQTDVWTLFHSFSFDFSVWEMWGALLYGGRLVMVPFELSRDPLAFYQLVRREGVTVLNQTPSEFRLFERAAALAATQERGDSESPDAHAAPDLRYIMLGGEALDLRTLAAWFARHGDRQPQLVNLYGITETTVIITQRPLQAADAHETRSLIGVAIPDLVLYVLDAEGRPVPIGAEGELWVGGAGVARGYLRRPTLTAERFRQLPRPGPESPPPTATADLVYRTGDLVRQHADGELEYLGRIDQQVKIGGHRIELGEIEAALRRSAQVADAAVIVRREGSTPSLAAYVVGRTEQGIDLAQLRSELRGQLPEYMCPASLQAVAQIPLTVNGKLDRDALPAPPALPQAASTTGWSESEQAVAALFASALGHEVDSAEADFFAQGGSSLLAMQLSLQVAEQLGVTLPPGGVFQQPTVRGLAATIDRLRQQGSSGPAEPAPADPADWQPLSPIQEQMWFVQSLSPDSPAFHCPAAFRIRGALDCERLQAALSTVQERHALLRARFSLHEGRPQQRIAAAPTFTLQRVAAVAAPAELAVRLRELAQRPFDLAQAAGAAWLLPVAADEQIFLLVLHHLITDGWSIEQLLRELSEAYQQVPISPPKTSYFQHQAAARRRAERGELTTSESYFLADLAQVPPTSELPTEWPRPRTPSLRGSLRPFTLPAATRALMQPLMQAEGATASTLLFAALFALLHRYSGQRDLVIGMPYAGRDTPGSESLQGPLLNLLPIHITLPEAVAQATFRSLIRSVRGKTHTAYAHSDLPFARLRQLLPGERDSSRHPLFQLAFAPQPGARGSLRLGGLVVEPVVVDPGKSPYDLTLYAWPDAGPANPADAGADAALYCELEYADDLFSGAMIERFLDHFARLLMAGCQAPDQPLSELALLSVAERALLLDNWSGQAAAQQARVATPLLPIERFAQVVQQQPQAEAIRCGSQIVRYAELDAWSQRIAAALRARGIGRESLVALLCPRSPAAIAGILGVWQAGAAYVPLDPSYPEQRLAFMLRDSGAALTLTVPETTELAGDSAAKLDIAALATAAPEKDEAAAGAAMTAAANASRSSSEGSALAYVIYTSGSTGQPKGVLIEQHNLATLAEAIPAAFPLAPGRRLLQFASLSFDWSVAEVLIALLQGGTLVIPAQRTPLSGLELWEFLAAEQIAQVLLPPSVLSQLPEQPLPQLELLLVGGERCPAHLVERFARGRCFRNAYGPTEATIVATVHECQGSPALAAAQPPARVAEPAIGRPLPGAEVYVLDGCGRLVPPLVPGELHIGGCGLARGYLARPELSAERFPSSLPEVNKRLYRTGDLVRWRADGTLEFLGRRDDQRKVRGFRIELGEIESALRNQVGVKSAAVLVDGEGAAARVLAYVVRSEPAAEAAAATSEPDFLAELRRALRATLPAQLIPADIMILPSLPLTPNGKLDARSLPRHALCTEPEVTTQTKWEALVAEIWFAVLGRKVPRTANFFDVGGSSLRLIEVQARLEAQVGSRIPLADLFANPTIEAMGALIERGRPSGTDAQRAASDRAARAQAHKPSGRRGR